MVWPHVNPDKTFIGKIDRRFDFLGYHLNPQAANGLTAAKKTIDNHVANITRFYEQGASIDRIGNYIRNWWRWVKGGVTIDHNTKNLVSVLLPRLPL